MTEVDSIPRGRKIWNDKLEVSFIYLKKIVSYENILNETHFPIQFILNDDASDKHMGAVTSKKKEIPFPK